MILTVLGIIAIIAVVMLGITLMFRAGRCWISQWAIWDVMGAALKAIGEGMGGID